MDSESYKGGPDVLAPRILPKECGEACYTKEPPNIFAPLEEKQCGEACYTKRTLDREASPPKPCAFCEKLLQIAKLTIVHKTTDDAFNRVMDLIEKCPCFKRN